MDERERNYKNVEISHTKQSGDPAAWWLDVGLRIYFHKKKLALPEI